MTNGFLPRISTIILAGGASRRMGRDKAFVDLGGAPLIMRVIERVVPLCTEIILVTNDPFPYGQFGCRIVNDVYPGKGSLGGIFSGLLAAREAYALTVACDMPFLNVELLEYLISLAPQYDVVIPRAQGRSGKAAHLLDTIGIGSGRSPQPTTGPAAKEFDLHPMHAVYSKNCLQAIQTRLLQNDLRAPAFHDLVRVRVVEPAEVDRFDPQHLSFFNANTPADLETARVLYDEAMKDV